MIKKIDDGRKIEEWERKIEGGKKGDIMRSENKGIVEKIKEIEVEIGKKGKRKNKERKVVEGKEKRNLNWKMRKKEMIWEKKKNELKRRVGWRVRKVIGKEMEKEKNVMVIIENRSGERKKSEIGNGGERGKSIIKKVKDWEEIDERIRIWKKRKEKLRMLVEKNKIREDFRRLKRWRKKGWKRKKEKKIEIGIKDGIGVGKGLGWRFEKKGREKDERIVKIVKEDIRKNEGIVVEEWRKENGERIVDRKKIMIKRRKVVMDIGFKEVIKIKRGGESVRIEKERKEREENKRVRILGKGGKNEEREVIFEREESKMLEIGKKGGGKSVELKEGIGIEVEGEEKGIGIVEEDFVMNENVSNNLV